MARDERAPDRGKVKVRVIEFEMEGSNQTLRESIRDIVGAIGKGQQVVRVMPQALEQKGSTGNETDASPASDHSDEMAPESETDETDDEVALNPRPRRTRKAKSLKIVAVDLVGDNPLKDFLATAPTALEKRYILIAYWFKTYRQIPTITPDHIYTAYMAMSWTTLPRDSTKPFRRAKEDGAFEKAEGDCSFTITHIGEMKAMDLIQKAGANK